VAVLFGPYSRKYSNPDPLPIFSQLGLRRAAAELLCFSDRSAS
jgi:hypothetical protein